MSDSYGEPQQQEPRVMGPAVKAGVAAAVVAVVAAIARVAASAFA